MHYTISSLLLRREDLRRGNARASTKNIFFGAKNMEEERLCV
jgi:hypothetical protein